MRFLSTYFLVVLILCSANLRSEERGLVHDKSSTHQALIVGAAHSLPGIDIDMETATKIATHSDYQFTPTRLFNAEATVKNIESHLTTLMAKADQNGTFLFYYSGHGSKLSLYVQDGLLTAKQMRAALEKGREGLGPVSRLILILDSCYSGSLLDPFRLIPDFDKSANEAFVNHLTSELFNRADYWKSLFVFASSRANETSLASKKGGVFTNAMYQAFNESMDQNLLMKEFVERSQKYTWGHHPVARFVPSDMENERMRL